MGKRSRRQQTSAPPSLKDEDDRAGAGAGGRRDHRFAAAERSIKQRPPAPWDPFPLAELGILIGLVALGIGWFTGGDLGEALRVGGFTLAALGGLDTILREHLNGYRSHAGLIAGALLILALVISTSLFDVGIVPRAAIAVVVFGLAFTALRRDFIRRSGGKRVL
ncbi:MAG: hypothetical protein HZB14_06700 [Actinobacteria bacterium]|nr:hypothetical protein [Actinomycetota bacterium]